MRSALCLPLVFLLTSTAFAGCVFYANVDNGAARITCDDDVDCPPTWSCASSLCVAPVDVVSPRIVNASFEPRVARANVPVRLTIVADEELGADPVLTFSAEPGLVAGDPEDVVGDDTGAFLLVERAGARAVFERRFLPGESDLAVGLDSVVLEDVHGNRGTVVVDEGGQLFVDRTQPLLVSITANAARYSAVAPFSAVTAFVDVEEGFDAPASLAVFLGNVPLDCANNPTASPGSGGFDSGVLEPVVCTGLVNTSTPEGNVVLQAVASDEAGNIAVVGTSVVIDRTAPTPVAAPPATLVISGGGAAALAPTLVPGSIVTLTFSASEPLAAAAVSGLLSSSPSSGSAPPAFVLATTIDGALRERVAATATLQALPLGTYRADAVLTDDVGNVSAPLSLALPAPGLVVSQGVPSPCVASFQDEIPVCTDFDHDGFFGASEDCSAFQANDCHDDDPFVHPDAFDVPGDLSDNRCGGTQGAPLDETTAVFVSPDGSDKGDGSRANPKRSLQAALAALDDVGARRAIALRAGAYVDENEAPDVVGGEAPLVIVGGLDAQWQRGGGDSVVQFACVSADNDSESTALIANDAIHVVDVTLAGGDCGRLLQASAVTLRRSVVRGTCNGVVDGCYVASLAPLTAWQTSFDGVRVFSTQAVLLDSALVNAPVYGDSIDMVRSRVSGASSLDGLTIRIVSSVVEADVIVEQDFAAYHAIVSGTRIFAQSAAATARFDNSIVIMSEVAWGAEPDGANIIVRGSDLFAPCVTPSCTGSVQDCNFPGCAHSAFSFNVPPLLELDGIHLSAASPLADVGMGNAVDLGAPTSLAGDIDGECRITGATPDIGADEL